MSTEPAIKRNSSQVPFLQTTLGSLFSRVRGTMTARYEDRIARKAFIKTFSLSDRMLDDIGVTREEVEWAACLPIQVDAADALSERARTRLAAGSADHLQDVPNPKSGGKK
ncbi:DUF1127 domain-containing protein [Tabrizicola sp.]|uniref:DUF1127 domain-containing protein n=1 Tax=Tabrizicola sp. TaxID=2005166 RepID=UPI00286D02EC|nr:DUF1127 domain-containing protein [Tabrizicola sp.]